MSTASLQCGEAGCRAVLGSVEGAFPPPGHVADELSSPSWEVVLRVLSGVIWGHIILSPSDFVGLVECLYL